MITHLKACYKEGVNCGRNKTGGALVRYNLGDLTTTYDQAEYKISQKWLRVNSYGYGVPCIRMPLIILNIITSNTTCIKIEHLSNRDRLSMLFHSSINDASILSLSGQLRDGNINGALKSNELNIHIRGHLGIFYNDCVDNLMSQAVAFAVAGESEYVYNNLWTNSAMWTFLMLSRTSTGAGISGAANMRLAQQGIVDLVTQHMAQGGNVDDIMWYQMLYYCINTKSKTNRVSEYVDAEMAQTWCEENAPDAVAKYF